MVTSSETWSEEARAGADILDLDRYMRGTRPARRAPPRDTSRPGLVVDGGAAGAGAGAGGSSSASSASEPSDKRFSHDSGLSDTTYRHQHRVRRKKVISSSGSRSGTDTVERRRSNKSGGEAKDRRRRDKSGSEANEGRRGNKSGGEAKEKRRSKTSGGEATDRRGKRTGGEAARRGSSESNRSFRESLERALREQQAQIARVAALCERQARSERTSERHSERRSERQERGGRPSERHAERRAGGRSSSASTDLSSSSSSLDPLKRRSPDCRTYKIIMSKLDELNRMFAARRALPAAAAAPAGVAAPPAAPHRARARDASSGSVTVSDKVVGTDSQQHTTRQAKPRATSVVTAAAVDIPPRNNIVTESVVRGEVSAPPSDRGMPGRFHLDDPVRLYKQAKRLEAARADRRSSAGSSSPGSRGSRGSARGSAGSRGSARGSEGSRGSARGSANRSPSLCALCRCYWTVARRYVAAQLTAVRE